MRLVSDLMKKQLEQDENDNTAIVKLLIDDIGIAKGLLTRTN
jgi:hypothetical protein